MMAQLTRYEGRRHRRRSSSSTKDGRGFRSGGVSPVLNVIKRNLISGSPTVRKPGAPSGIHDGRGGGSY